MNSYGVLKRNVTSENCKKPKKNITNLTFEAIVHNIKVLAGDVLGDVLVFSGDVLGDVLVSEHEFDESDELGWRDA